MPNYKLTYIEPEDSPSGQPCRGCDLPGTKDNPVVLQGYAPNGKPLFGHIGCQSLNGSNSTTSALPTAVAANLGLIPNYKEEQENIWAFAAVNKFDFTQNETNEQLEKMPAQKPDTRVDAASQYAENGTGASVPPSK